MVGGAQVDSVHEEKISEVLPKSLEELLDKIRDYFPNADLSIIEKAYTTSERAHVGQIRRSGEPYISHPLSVAAILADLHLDLASIATGLLHDTVEDTRVTLEDIQRDFGPVIAGLVDGVTKISKMTFRNTLEKQGENIRKMIVAMGKDVRVILVKLADRLHNMRTLNHMSPDKQIQIAQETLDIYAPLASRLGISSLKIELEDLSFRYLKPDKYYDLVQKVAKKKKEREKYIDEVKRILTSELEKKTKIKFDIQGRPKHFYSIFRKMQARNIDYDQVYDVLAFRVIVGTISECYEVVGHVHSLWKPIPGRFKDFIAMPKANKYQSLHTTVIGPGGERIEIQIRTQEMHLIAERGIAAHWQYKENMSAETQALDKFNWLRDLVALHQQAGSPDEFLDNVKTDLFGSEIYVFTPKGDVKELPEGATPLDFAYAIHTDVGHHTQGARVNGRFVPLKHELQSGDTVEVITSNHQRPSKDWLKFCVTSRAKSKIRAYITNEQRKRATELGHEMLEKEFRKFGMSLARVLKTPEFEKALRDLGAHDEDDLCALIGYGRVMTSTVVAKVNPGQKTEVSNASSSFMEKVFRSAIHRKKRFSSIVNVDGMPDVLVRFAKCCNPIPGDPIVGFISHGRGITIHKGDCSRVFELDKGRRIDVGWNSTGSSEVDRLVRLRVVCHDIPGLLKSMTEAFGTQGMNILSAQIRTTKDKKAVCIFDVNVRDTTQLRQVIQDLEKIKGILAVTRMVQT